MLPASDPEKQGELLENMCTNADLEKLVNCSFDPTARDEGAFGAPHLFGGVHPNCTDKEIEVKISEDQMRGSEDSTGVKLGTEVKYEAFGLKVKSSIELEYGHKWLYEHTFKHELTYPVEPKHVGYVIGKNPVIRVTGNITVKIGNTTLIARNVHFDSPDPSREGQELWEPHAPPMTTEEKKQCEEHHLTQAPASWASATQRGTERADTL